MAEPAPPLQRQAFTSHLLLSDEDIVKMGISPDDAEIFRRKQYQASFGISTWYDALQEHTFRTVHVPIQFDEGNAIVLKHELSFKEYPPEAIAEADRLLLQIQMRLDETLRTFPQGAFIKLNTRSPKDVPVNDDNNPQVVKLVMDEMPPPGKRTQDAVCLAYVIGTNKFLHVKSSQQAIDLLVRSSRITEDLHKMVQFGAKFFDTCIVVREWLEEATQRIPYEFRGFVHKNKLNALTQYFDFIYCDDLHRNKDAIAERIQQYYYAINSRITHESYVIDFLVLRDRILIIELNPFHNGAGASLFSWTKDRERFMHGPFEFRVITQPNPPQGNGILSKRWAALIDCPPPKPPAPPDMQGAQKPDEESTNGCVVS